MSALATVTVGDRERPLVELPNPIGPSALLDPPTGGGWQIEIGFGKGRYLLEQATERPQDRFIGIEMVGKYARMVAQRAARRRLLNLAVVRGEALYLLAAVLRTGFADTLHVYFPDPWPKSKHHRRRLFDPTSVDLVLGVLRPGGKLFFATDFLDYGEAVTALLERTPTVVNLERLDAPWPDGARTHYEAKYLREGRPIVRLIAEVAASARDRAFHPDGRERILAATAPDATGNGARRW